MNASPSRTHELRAAMDVAGPFGAFGVQGDLARPAAPDSSSRAMKLPARWKELSPLFDELVELDRSAQATRMLELARSDPELARHLAAMLGAAEHADEARFLVRGRELASASGLSMRGRRIGPYHIEGELGHGGSGSVWKARRIDGERNEVVAIKLLHLSLLAPSHIARFQGEGAMLARLHHPNIVQMLDTGLTPEGQPYLVLEHVDGLPIDQYCDLNRVDLPGRLRLLREVMDTISHAHGQQIVHRDIKPGNILVTPQGQVKLLDFGIAKPLVDAPEAALLTLDGQRPLTPRYAAPEQFEGTAVTARTDVYSLGVLMYRLLVGRYPTSTDGASATEIITGTLTAEPVALKRVLERLAETAEAEARAIAAGRDTTLAGLKSLVRSDLDIIVSRALRKMPEQRYDSVDAFAADIARYLDGRPVRARANARRGRFGRFVRRQRPAVGASAILALSVLAGLVGSTEHRPWAGWIHDVALRQSTPPDPVEAVRHRPAVEWQEANDAGLLTLQSRSTVSRRS